MALGLKRWAAWLLAGMAFLAIWQWPLASPPPARPGSEFVRPARQVYFELEARVRTEGAVLRRLGELDSLEAVLAGTERPSAGPVVGLPPELPLLAAARFQEAVAREAAALAGGPGDVTVGVFVVHDPGQPRWTGDEYYVGRSAGSSYCLAVRRVHTLDEEGASLRVADGDGKRRTDVLGPCALFLRHGLPGPRVAAWLEGGSLGRATRREIPAGYLAELTTSAAFGRHAYPGGLVSPRGLRCLEGSLPACREVFLAGGVEGSLWLTSVMLRVPELWHGDRGVTWGVDFALADPAFLWEMERAFGPDAFQRFWRSGVPSETAFEEAFGVPADAWTGVWARSLHGEGRAALRAGPGDWTWTLLVVLGALALAVRTALRRQSG